MHMRIDEAGCDQAAGIVQERRLRNAREQITGRPNGFDLSVAADHDAIALDREGLGGIREERIVHAAHQSAAQRGDAATRGDAVR